MPEESTKKRAEEDLREGKAPSTAAGEFVHEEIEHVREGKHGARSAKQAIAIGLSKARRAGIPLKPPAKGKTSESTRKNAERAYEKGQSGKAEKPSPGLLGLAKKRGSGSHAQQLRTARFLHSHEPLRENEAKDSRVLRRHREHMKR
jgi:hypothetical protein